MSVRETEEEWKENNRGPTRGAGPMRILQKVSLATFVTMGVVVLFLHQSPKSSPQFTLQSSAQSRVKGLGVVYKEWPEFDGSRQHSKEWYVHNCFGGNYLEEVEAVFTIHLPQWSRSQELNCTVLYRQFNELFEVHHRYTLPLIFPEPFLPKVMGWLGGKSRLMKLIHHQHIIHVVLVVTGEHSMYNPLRSQRPRPKVKVDLNAWVDQQSEELRSTCDFCQAANMTAADDMGRHLTKETIRVSNTFKVERYHTLVVTRHQHHPLNFTLPTFTAFFTDAALYAQEVAKSEPQYRYTNIAWDSLYQAGVSQLHPHVHIMMSPDHYYGYYEFLRQAGQRYHDATGRNLFTVLTRLHDALGLTVRYGSAVAFPTIVGKADMEVMFLAPFPGPDFYRLLYFVIAAYHDTYTQLCKGFSAVYPALGEGAEARAGKIPVIARLISRGDCLSPRTDYTSYEIFQMVERNHDPWQVADAIRRSIQKHDKSS